MPQERSDFQLPRHGQRLTTGSSTVGAVTCRVPHESEATGVVCRNNSTGQGIEASAVAARKRTS
jgi:hypothetical protein